MKTKIKEKLFHAEVTQAEISRHSGIHQSTINLILNGRMVANNDQKNKIVDTCIELGATDVEKKDLNILSAK